MKKTLIAALAILVALTSLAAQPLIRTLSIKETAEISISPDLCVMTILVETQDKDSVMIQAKMDKLPKLEFALRV